jgi:protein-arginine kinase activator protein McsA
MTNRDDLIHRLLAEANKADDAHADLMREAADALSAQPEQAQEAISEELVCPECDEGFVLGSRVWLACSKCHGSGRTDRLGDYVPGTRRKKDKTEAETSATASVAGLSAAAPAVEGHEAIEQMLNDLVRMAQHVGATHNQYMGKAMSDEVYDRFATLRDDTIPALKRKLLAALTTHRELPAAQQERQEVSGELRDMLDVLSENVVNLLTYLMERGLPERRFALASQVLAQAKEVRAAISPSHSTT